MRGVTLCCLIIICLLISAGDCKKRNKKVKKVSQKAAEDDEFAAQDKLPKRFFGAKDEVRPFLAFPGNADRNVNGLNTVPPLSCGGAAILRPGVNLRLETQNYPGNMTAHSSCYWDLIVTSGTYVTFLCEMIDVPCDEGSTMSFYFSNRGRTRICSRGSSGVINQRFEYVHYVDRHYRSVIIVRSDNSNSARVGCTLRSMGGGGGGSGSTTTPPPASSTTPSTGNPPECGTTVFNSGTRIIGGGFATPREYPFMAYLYSAGGSCGSTVLTSQYFLTAAHCVENVQSGHILPGCHDISNCNSLPIKVHIRHPNYNFPHYDLAILKLLSPLSGFSDTIRPVCLPLPGSDRLQLGATANVTGWGRTSTLTNDPSVVLKEAAVRVIDCSGAFPTSVCTVGVTGNTCKGDSGGFFGAQVNGRWFQFGVTSFGTNSNCANGVEGFADTVESASWIRHQIY